MTAGKQGRSDDALRGLVSNIQPFSLHDGPGIRTTVFLKGCRWRCLWCANPETQAARRELGFLPEKCRRCGRCAAACPRHGDDAIQVATDGLPRFRRALCAACLDAAGDPPCVAQCPGGALRVYGEWMRVDDVLDAVEAESAFYRHGGGGLTLSGGEALDQPEFALALLRGAQARGIGTLLETSGSSAQVLVRAGEFLDGLFCDVKHHDAAEHRRLTGAALEPTHAALRAVREAYPALPIRIRTPVVPGYTLAPGLTPDSPALEEAAAMFRGIAAFAASLGNSEYELLPCHVYGGGKYEALGREMPPLEAPGEDIMNALRDALGDTVHMV